MGMVTTKDGTGDFLQGLGVRAADRVQPRLAAVGRRLDPQMLFFLGKGYRVIAHDRRGHGRSTQTGGGHDMDHYADDLAALTAHLDLKERDPYRPFDRRRRGHPLSGAARRKPGGEGGVDQRSAAADGEDAGQSRRDFRRRFSTACRRSSPPTGRSSITICRPDPSTASTGRA